MTVKKSISTLEDDVQSLKQELKICSSVTNEKKLIMKDKIKNLKEIADLLWPKYLEWPKHLCKYFVWILLFLFPIFLFWFKDIVDF